MKMKSPEDVKILVIGDIMLDKYIVGDVNRISPEFPVPIVHVKEEYDTLGGCGNVVRNLRELGAQVDCLTCIGYDNSSEMILREMERIGANTRWMIRKPDYQTIVKTRIIADERKVQMLRVDYEKIEEIDAQFSFDVLYTNKLEKYDMIVVSDYAKGMITADLMEYLKDNWGEKIIVDPKPKNAKLYNDVYMITPNEKEWKEMQTVLMHGGYTIPYILETKGKDGMTLHINEQRDRSRVRIDSTPVEVSNVSGAGDTVVAVMSLCLSMGYNPIDSAEIANQCAGYVVTQPGTSVVPKTLFTKIGRSIHGVYS